MKLKKDEPKLPSDSPLKKGRAPRKAVPIYTEEDRENTEKAMEDFLAKWGQKPVGGRMVLNNEIGLKWKNPIWLEVDEVIRELDPGQFNSFACLARPGNTYIQCLRGLNGWHLEARITWKSPNDFSHLRACRPGGSEKPRALKQVNYVSRGEFRDLLKLEDVLAAFQAFHANKIMPPLMWRPIDI